jgi:hypothetical protein
MLHDGRVDPSGCVALFTRTRTPHRASYRSIWLPGTRSRRSPCAAPPCPSARGPATYEERRRDSYTRNRALSCCDERRLVCDCVRRLLRRLFIWRHRVRDGRLDCDWDRDTGRRLGRKRCVLRRPSKTFAEPADRPLPTAPRSQAGANRRSAVALVAMHSVSPPAGCLLPVSAEGALPDARAMSETIESASRCWPICIAMGKLTLLAVMPALRPFDDPLPRRSPAPLGPDLRVCRTLTVLEGSPRGRWRRS